MNWVSNKCPTTEMADSKQNALKNDEEDNAACSPLPSPSPTKPRPHSILRLDSGKKSRRSSGMGSVEFRNDPELLGEVSK